MKNKQILFVIILLSVFVFACKALTLAPASEPVATLSPSLRDVDFPNQVMAYPPDWPVELRFPEEFKPADFSVGTFLDSSQKNGNVKLRYQGQPKEAADSLASFLSKNGWKIAERSDLAAGGILLIIQKDGGSGILVISVDENDAGQTLILATISM